MVAIIAAGGWPADSANSDSLLTRCAAGRWSAFLGSSSDLMSFDGRPDWPTALRVIRNSLSNRRVVRRGPPHGPLLVATRCCPDRSAIIFSGDLTFTVNSASGRKRGKFAVGRYQFGVSGEGAVAVVRVFRGSLPIPPLVSAVVGPHLERILCPPTVWAESGLSAPAG